MHGDDRAHQTGAETDALQKSTSSANFQNKQQTNKQTNKQTITYKQTLNRFDVWKLLHAQLKYSVRPEYE